MSNLVSLSELINDKFCKNEFFFSMEVFPPKTELDLKNLYINLNEFLNKFKPLFCDITYHLNSQKPIEHSCSSFSIANYLNKNFNLNSVLHFTCAGKNLLEINLFLDKTKEFNIRNLFVLRGDKSFINCTDNLIDHHFNYANELVTYIRERHNSFYTISVAAYPNKHSEAKNLDEDIDYLKQKLDNGADFCLTQIIFQADDFIEFVKKCKDKNIEKPIIPGILPVYKLDSLKQITKFCKVNVPDEFTNYLEQNNNENNLKFAIQYFVNLGKKLIESKTTIGLHFYTMNDFKLIENILSELKL